MRHSSEPLPDVTQPIPRRQKKKRVEAHANHERWLVSYADFITLMFAFFTMLYAISTVDAKKLAATVESMDQAFESGGRVIKAPKEAGKQPTPDKADGSTVGEMGLAELQVRFKERLAKEIAQKRVDIETDQRGLVISIREAGSFTSGSAELSADAKSLLSQIATTLVDINNQVRIEGHTDDTPIHTARFASNWELSTTRATNVIAFMQTEAHVPPERVSAAGYAEFRPRVPNASVTERARNRRVDLVILNMATKAAEEPAKLGTDKAAAHPLADPHAKPAH